MDIHIVSTKKTRHLHIQSRLVEALFGVGDEASLEACEAVVRGVRAEIAAQAVQRLQTRAADAVEFVEHMMRSE